MKNLKSIVICAALLGWAMGYVTGKLLLGPMASIFFWGLAGLISGFFVTSKKEILYVGVGYGLFLTFSFLLSRFGGAPDKLPAYLLFTLVMSVGGMAGGVLSIYVGNTIRKYLS